MRATVEVIRIPNGGDQRAGRDGADAGHPSRLAAEVTVSMPCLNLCLQLFDLTSEIVEEVEQSLDEHTKGSRQLVACVFDQLPGP